LLVRQSRDVPTPAGAPPVENPRFISQNTALTLLVAALLVLLAYLSGGYSTAVFAATGLVAWWTVVIGFGTGTLPLRRLPAPALVAAACLAALAAWTAISMAWSGNQGRAFEEFVRVTGYAGLFMAVASLSRRESLRGWILGIVAGATAVSVLALVGRCLPWLGAESALDLAYSRGRLEWPVGYWNGLAALSALSALGLAWLASEAATVRGRAAATALLPVPAIAVYLTLSRGGIVAVAIGLLIMLAIGPGRNRMILGWLLAAPVIAALLVAVIPLDALSRGVPRHTIESEGPLLLALTAAGGAALHWARRRLDGRIMKSSLPRSFWRGLTVLGCAGVVALGVLATSGGVVESYTPSQSQVNAPTGKRLLSFESSGRSQYWETALDAFGAEPLRGIGAGGYEWWWLEHTRTQSFVRSAHSVFLEVLAELGVIGELLLLAFVGVVVWAATQRIGRSVAKPEGAVLAALVAAGLFSAGIDWTWDLVAVYAPVILVAALLTGPATAPEPVGGPGPARPVARTPSALRAATLIAGAVAVWACGVQLISSERLDQSQAAAAAGDTARAVQLAKQASGVAPWSGGAKLQLGLAEESGGALFAARQDLEEAARLAPKDWQIWLALSRVRLELGDVRGAYAALKRYRMLVPAASPAN
jgi:O-antigen ligase/polysaccharide polymerase Wzy-like membrane protein